MLQRERVCYRESYVTESYVTERERELMLMQEAVFKRLLLATQSRQSLRANLNIDVMKDSPIVYGRINILKLLSKVYIRQTSLLTELYHIQL